MEKIIFEIGFLKANGEMRETFKTWHIPETIFKQHSIKKKPSYFVEMSVGDWKETKICRISSGQEIGVGKEIGEQLREIAKKKPSGKVTFVLQPIGLIVFESTVREAFEDSVKKALLNSQRERQARLKSASKTPKNCIVSAKIYIRNPDVVAEVLSKAKGKCGKCKNKAPFQRRKDNTPYLEVHHTVKLADGGDDSVDNAIALCPNCHREEHYG